MLTGETSAIASQSAQSVQTSTQPQLCLQNAMVAECFECVSRRCNVAPLAMQAPPVPVVQQSDTRNRKCLKSHSSSSSKKENVHSKSTEQKSNLQRGRLTPATAPLVVESTRSTTTYSKICFCRGTSLTTSKVSFKL